ncbi:hypothetical protein G7Y79_00018g045730 [Physcia stellaris]|nr:hypothetical protein G7Y79_00018g045730 [Physcia stellaris]
MLLQAVLLLSLATAPSLATNTAGEPTDLANWPACAQKCIPQGFGPPADCGSLSNLTCICQQGAFTAQIATCERLGCGSQDFKDIGTLSGRLCAPVGGVGTAVGAAASTVLSTAQLSISSTPTVPASVTAATGGNPANISTYPVCAQICSNETIVIAEALDASVGDFNNINTLCSPSFRSGNAGCQAATCNSSDYQNTQILAQQLCGSLYNNNATLGSSVSSAIASATAAAKAATDGKDPGDLSNFPPCAQQCIKQNNYNGCGSNTNLECVCQGLQFNQAINPCERNGCSAADLQTVVYLAEKLCQPVGGVLTNPVNYTGGTGNGTSGSAPVPFTGGAVKARDLGVGLMLSCVVVGLGLLVL